MKNITSVQNSFIKDLLVLQEKSRERKKTGLFLIEGKREIELAQKGNFKLQSLLFCTQFLSLIELQNSIKSDAELIEISLEVYQKLAYRDTTEGIIAIAKTKNHEISELKLPINPLILVMEAPEKPGNIGALLRTADAANIDAVIIANPKTDLYNPNTIRSSVGTLFTNQIAVGTTVQIIEYLSKNNINIYAATLQNSTAYHTQNFQKPTALVVGTESVGLTQEWRNAATQNIIIPMQGQIDSMNVSVAAAILIYEAKRQRNFQ